MLTLFYVEDISSPKLIDENAHHASRVLRMKVGEELLVSNGSGKWARCKIEAITKSEVELLSLDEGFEAPAKKRVSVLQALPKSDRAKEAVELLTASGVDEIYPWQASRSIGKESDKWKVASIEAGKQSRRFYLPKVSEKLTTNDAIELFQGFEQILICHESGSSQLSEVVRDASNTLIVIGPEGGISDEELNIFSINGGKVVKLGNSILRSAHAGIAAVSAVKALIKVW